MQLVAAQGVPPLPGGGGGRYTVQQDEYFLGGRWHASFHIVTDNMHFMYRRPTLYPLEIAVDFLKSL